MKDFITALKKGWESKHTTICGAISALCFFLWTNRDEAHLPPLLAKFFAFVASGGLGMLGLLSVQSKGPDDAR